MESYDYISVVSHFKLGNKMSHLKKMATLEFHETNSHYLSRMSQHFNGLRPVKSSSLCRASEHILHLAGLSHGVGLPPPIILTEQPWDSLDWLGESEPDTSRKTMGKTMVSCRFSLKQIECSMKNHGVFPMKYGGLLL
jgi:hypothetical protein